MKPVMITTKHRGVFFGYLNGTPRNLPSEVDLKDARNCIYWSADCKGFLGLAATGPTGGCRIGPKVDSITLYDVTSITPVSDTARDKWETAPWK